MVKKYLLFALISSVAATFTNCSKKITEGETPVQVVNPPAATKSDVTMWLTTADKSALLQKQNVSLNFSNTSSQNTTITIDTTQTYQTIDGFGFTLTGGSASLINNLGATQSNALLKELFLTDSSHIGISYLRISVGASDLSAAPFTYDDLASGQTDVNLTNFSIDKEKTDLIPVLKKIIALNPAIKILACPWSAPTWMKTNNSFIGGSLNTIYYDAYARYFVKYIQAMQAQGITIDAITPQNEPLNPNNNPSMVMQASEAANFIKNNLGPQFKTAGINTKIIVYDHNTDRTDYPLTILADQAANPFVDGSAFHLYAGDISALTPVHQAFPAKNIYFT
ncbi:MAG: glucosylceramidase, partial [Sphingobacteriaceae bacterium]